MLNVAMFGMTAKQWHEALAAREHHQDFHRLFLRLPQPAPHRAATDSAEDCPRRVPLLPQPQRSRRTRHNRPYRNVRRRKRVEPEAFNPQTVNSKQ